MGFPDGSDDKESACNARDLALIKGMATHSVFLPGEFHGQKSLVGYSQWGRRV